MPKTQDLLKFLGTENNLGVLLVVQMGGAPEELQLIVQTATYDEGISGLREKTAYIIRVLGVKEHRATLGVFKSLFIADDHPILFHHNASRQRIDFQGTPQDTNELVLDVQAAYSATFGPFRDLGEDVNRAQPLYDLFQSGGGTLGVMPLPAAQRMVKVFEHHGMTASLEEVEPARVPADDEKAAQFETTLKLLGMDDSYFIAYGFTVEEMNARPS